MMIYHNLQLSKNDSPAMRRGFALIATISVMVLLVMIALAMLSLSAIETRAAQNGLAQAEARANARLALMLSLGDLQKHLGDDRRITAPATQGNYAGTSGNTGVFGVWDGRSYGDELQNTLDSNYYARSTNFRKWMVSSSDPTQTEDVDFAANGALDNEVILVRNAKDSTLSLKAGRVGISRGNAQGNLAWVVRDASMNARLDSEALMGNKLPTDTAMQMMRSGLPGDEGHKIIPALQNVDPDHGIKGKYITAKQFDLLEDIVAGTTSDDVSTYLTPYSLSLNTDVKAGGWKKDLSLLLELDEDQLPEEFSRDEYYTHPHGWAGGISHNGYKLSEIANKHGISDNYDTLPMALLYNYYRISKMGKSQQTQTKVNDGTNGKLVRGRPSVTMYTGIPGDMEWRGYGHTLRVAPVITRTRDVIWVMTQQVPGESASADHEVRFASFPVVTLWNPYNVDLQMRTMVSQYKLHVLEAKVNGVTYPLGGRAVMKWGGAADQQPVTFKPGESKVFFPDFASSTSPTDLRMVNRWPADVGDVSKYTTKLSDSQKFRGSAATVVSIGLSPRTESTASYNDMTHYNDGWFTDSINQWKTTKSNHWNWNMRPLVDGGIIEGKDEYVRKSLGEMLNSPSPIAILNVGVKSTDDPDQPGMMWSFDYPQRMNPDLHYKGQTSLNLKGGRQASLMHYSFTPLRGVTDLSKELSTLENADNSVNDYMGFSYNPARGASYLTACELPMVPVHSMGQLQHLPLQDENRSKDWSRLPVQPTWNYGIGNSWAHPWLSSETLLENRTMYDPLNGQRKATAFQSGVVDRLWVANSLMWDSYSFSTMAPQDNAWFASHGATRGLKTVSDEFFSFNRSLPNRRLVPWPAGESSDELTERFLTGGKPKPGAYKVFNSRVATLGGFNINSTSIEAWKILLASTFKQSIPHIDARDNRSVSLKPASDRYVISRFTVPNGPSIDDGGDPWTDGFNGYRELTEYQIEELAKAIVEEVKERGPFRSLGEFVNRRRGPASDEKSLYGALQGALEDQSVSINEAYRYDRFAKGDFPDATFVNPNAVSGPKARGIPGYVTQADILTPIASAITARGDTFIITAYGESKAKDGRVLARAKCEAVVQRTPDFVDGNDSRETDLDDLTSQANKIFGRQFKIVRFSWVNV